jgi:argininosuccinate synthase
MTILRLAHLDLEGLVMDGQVRSLRDQFVTHKWSELLYNGMVNSSYTVARVFFLTPETSISRQNENLWRRPASSRRSG